MLQRAIRYFWAIDEFHECRETRGGGSGEGMGGREGDGEREEVLGGMERWWRGCWGMEGGGGGGAWEGDGGEVGGGCRRGCGEGCPDSLTAAQKIVKLVGGGAEIPVSRRT